MGDEEDQLRRHLQALSAVNRQLYAQLAEANQAAGRRPTPADGGARHHVLGLGRWTWRRAEPLLPAPVAEVLRRRVRARILGSPTQRPPSGKPRPPARPTGPSAGSDGKTVPADWVSALDQKASRSSLVRRPGGAVYVLEGDQARHVPSSLVSAVLQEDLGLPRDVTDAHVERLTEGPPVNVLSTSSAEPPFVIVGGRRRPIRYLPGPEPVNAGAVARFREGKPLDMARSVVPRLRYEREAGRLGGLATRLPRPVAINGARVARLARRLIIRP